MAKHVLLTGFEPFGGERLNPSEVVARSLEGRLIGGRLIVTRILPVETRTLHERLERALSEEMPDIVVALGQATGATAVALERVAINVLDFDGSDNAGVVRQNEPVVRGGPDARLAVLPFEKIVDVWTENAVPGYVSNSAGTFLCNQTLYELLGLAQSTTPPVVAAFLHLPLLPAQAIAAGAARTPSMTLELARRAVELLIETLVPWVEQRPVDREAARPRGSQMWIPRGVKEVER